MLFWIVGRFLDRHNNNRKYVETRKINWEVTRLTPTQTTNRSHFSPKFLPFEILKLRCPTTEPYLCG